MDETKPVNETKPGEEEGSPGYDSPQYRIYREDTTTLDAQKLEVFKMYNGFLITMSTAIPGGSLLALKEFEDIIRFIQAMLGHAELGFYSHLGQDACFG